MQSISLHPLFDISILIYLARLSSLLAVFTNDLVNVSLTMSVVALYWSSENPCPCMFKQEKLPELSKKPSLVQK